MGVAGQKPVTGRFRGTMDLRHGNTGFNRQNTLRSLIGTLVKSQGLYKIEYITVAL